MEKSIIEISNVSKSFKTTKALDDVSIKIYPQEIFGFIGPNGAGKSTLIKSMMNLLMLDEGKIIINDLDVSISPEITNKDIGYLPSDINFYDDVKVKDLLKYKASFYQENDLDELIEILDLDTNKKMKELSLGNKKKVGIVLALAFKPKIIILDEPTSGLDPLIQQVFFDLLIKARDNGCTIFFSSHVLSEIARICQRVAIIKQGKIIETTKIENLVNKNYQKISIISDTLTLNSLNELQITDLKVHDNKISFNYHQDINLLLKILSNHHILALHIEDLSLEEIFLHYYQKSDQNV